MSHRTYIQCTPCACSLRSLSLLLALLFTSSGPIASSRSPSVRPRGRARRARARPRALPCPCVRLLMPGQRWTFLSAVSVWPALLARVCARCARLLPCLPAPVPVPVLATLAPCAWPACSRCSRLYCSFSRRALARCSTLSACRKLFRDRLRAVDIYPAVVGVGG